MEYDVDKQVEHVSGDLDQFMDNSKMIQIWNTNKLTEEDINFYINKAYFYFSSVYSEKDDIFTCKELRSDIKNIKKNFEFGNDRDD